MAAVSQLKSAPGFRDLPNHFSIEAYSLDLVHWEEGFVTENYIPVWSVWCKDDNGNVLMVSSGHTEADALRIVRSYGAKGLKQVYWAKENF